MNNLPKHHGAGPPEARVQCSYIGCIGLRPALLVTVVLRLFYVMQLNSVFPQSIFRVEHQILMDKIKVKSLILRVLHV